MYWIFNHEHLDAGYVVIKPSPGGISKSESSSMFKAPASPPPNEGVRNGSGVSMDKKSKNFNSAADLGQESIRFKVDESGRYFHG